MDRCGFTRGSEEHVNDAIKPEFDEAIGRNVDWGVGVGDNPHARVPRLGQRFHDAGKESRSAPQVLLKIVREFFQRLRIHAKALPIVSNEPALRCASTDVQVSERGDELVAGQRTPSR
jgi:hypothetical protein